VASADGTTVEPKHSILTTSSVLFDAVYVAGGEKAAMWAMESDAIDFVRDAYKHAKVVAATGEGVGLLAAAQIPTGAPNSADPADAATIVAPKMSRAVGDRFVQAMRRHRLWARELELHLPLEA
jgi:catalase